MNCSISIFRAYSVKNPRSARVYDGNKCCAWWIFCCDVHEIVHEIVHDSFLCFVNRINPVGTLVDGVVKFRVF